MPAAIALTKTLTATATLGRISSAYINGRRFQSVWSGPSIDYPRPTSERSSSSGNGLGLHTEWDKFPAGVVWDPRIGVRSGAFPYRITLTNEAVDGVAGSTGIAYAEYIEDDTSTTPYLRLRHAGVSAPSGGTKVLSFTINVEDCDGETASVDVSVTFYASDHASFSANFKWVDPSAGTNGTGTFASPINTLAGADVDGNPTLLGTDWNVATGRASTVMYLFKGTGNITMAAMSNPPDGSRTTRLFTIDASRSRQYIAIEGSDVTFVDSTTPRAIQLFFTNDTTFRGFTFTTSGGQAVEKYFEIVGGERQALYDLTFTDYQITGDPGGSAPACITTTSDSSEYLFISHCVGHNLDNDATPSNSSGVLGIFENVKILVDSVSITGSSTTFNTEYSFRFKHSTIDTEVRRCVDLSYGATHSAKGWSYGTGGGTNDHVRAVFRYNCIMNQNRALWTADSNSGLNTVEVHSVMYHFNTIKGPIVHGTDTDAAVENYAQFHAYGNLIENANSATNSGWGSMDVDYVIPTGKGALIESSIAGAIGALVDASGIPLDSANVGQYGHTVIS